MILRDFQHIKVVVLDVDGVLTDGTILVTEDGDQLRTFHVRDGFAIQAAVQAGIQIFVISGGSSSGVEKRLRALGIEHIHLGVVDKRALFLQLCEQFAIDRQCVLYMGDDIPDMEAMLQVGLPVCPKDAAEEIKAISRYMSPSCGGQGAVRDVLEKVLKTQNKWPVSSALKSI
ncbi:HAD-IIIA family hydrolase [Sphingobacterium sp. lm-10]|uniref:KdsC family phosphatase n=1 Tax=Sphingobacterium sp. lm-10 TaxID=2944904 RepID=UPI00201FC059|nr:HAD-IIIA family hydrolase [Sphingobacterium sp. lm-10]MCL7988126.1 HAD-IIIA family hydrolase [Sphingobacterium sp. lm-10]